MDKVTLAAFAWDPLVQTGSVAFAGAVVTQVLLRRYPTRRVIFQFAFFVALTALLHRHDIVPYQPIAADTPVFERVFVGMAKIIWWINAAWLLIGFTRVALFFERRPQESRLMQDLVVGTIYLGAALSVVAYVFGAPIGTLIATSGVLAIILGLALQSTLGDVFSGIALNVSKAYEVGDWVVLSGGMEGRVVETNWRATHLLNASNDLVVLPNSSLAKAQLTNLSSPNRSHGVKLRVRLMPTMAPAAISAVMRNVLLSSSSILSVPAPTVEIKSLDAQAVEFELAFRVADFEASSNARHEVYDLIFRHARSAGLALAYPKESGAVAPTPTSPAQPRGAALRLVDAVPLFASLTQDERSALADAMTRKTYRTGEVMVEQGAKLDSLIVVRSGVAVVTCHSEEGELELARLAPGDYFGDSVDAAGSGASATVRALAFTVAYEIGHDALAQLLLDRPTIAEEISTTLAQRRIGSAVRPGSVAAAAPPSVSALVSRLRRLL
jgi:small-conductance mechanosensitive channel